MNSQPIPPVTELKSSEVEALDQLVAWLTKSGLSPRVLDQLAGSQTVALYQKAKNTGKSSPWISLDQGHRQASLLYLL